MKNLNAVCYLSAATQQAGLRRPPYLICSLRPHCNDQQKAHAWKAWALSWPLVAGATVRSILPGQAGSCAHTSRHRLQASCSAAGRLLAVNHARSVAARTGLGANTVAGRTPYRFRIVPGRHVDNRLAVFLRDLPGPLASVTLKYAAAIALRTCRHDCLL
jgi:hypothetical protein